MERVLSADERIRKAEEIYARRKLQAESRKSATVNVDDRNNNKLVKKLIIQFILCLIIYISFYAIKNIFLNSLISLGARIIVVLSRK